jgi:hypothetical protein
VPERVDLEPSVGFNHLMVPPGRTLLTLQPASADRRPVDPPPVVELRVFEGDARERCDFLLQR